MSAESVLAVEQLLINRPELAASILVPTSDQTALIRALHELGIDFAVSRGADVVKIAELIRNVNAKFPPTSGGSRE